MLPQYIGLGMEIIDEEKGITDLYLDENNNLAMVTKAEAIGQHVRQRTKLFQGEWFLDKIAGVPWIQQLLGRPYNPGIAEAVVNTVVSETAVVTEI